MATAAAGLDWLEPLQQAAQRAAGQGNKATLITPWVNPDGTVKPEHEQYAIALTGAIHRFRPELLALMREAGAYVMARPGAFWFALPDSPGTRYEVPEIVPLTHFLPWATDAERAHAQ